MSKFKIKIENVVTFAVLNIRISLNDIIANIENTEYEPEQFPGLVYRINDPRVAFLLFGSGKIICTGAHKIDDIHRALEKFKEKLEEINIKIEVVDE